MNTYVYIHIFYIYTHICLYIYAYILALHNRRDNLQKKNPLMLPPPPRDRAHLQRVGPSCPRTGTGPRHVPRLPFWRGVRPREASWGFRRKTAFLYKCLPFLDTDLSTLSDFSMKETIQNTAEKKSLSAAAKIGTLGCSSALQFLTSPAFHFLAFLSGRERACRPTNPGYPVATTFKPVPRGTAVDTW